MHYCIIIYYFSILNQFHWFKKKFFFQSWWFFWPSLCPLEMITNLWNLVCVELDEQQSDWICKHFLWVSQKNSTATTKQKIKEFDLIIMKYCLIKTCLKLILMKKCLLDQKRVTITCSFAVFKAFLLDCTSLKCMNWLRLFLSRSS